MSQEICRLEEGHGTICSHWNTDLIGIPTICWKTFPAKTTKMLSTRNSSIKTDARTSTLQTWHQPKLQGQACIKFRDINFESLNHERDNDPNTKSKRMKLNLQWGP